MKQLIFLIVAVVLAIAATVLAFIFVVPEKRREKLNAFGKFLHDLCTFKFLVVEKILQALYIFSTAFIVLYGVLQLFNVQRDYWTGASRWMGGTGLLCIIVGPIAVRLSYELMMMAILLVKNVISINRKLIDTPVRYLRKFELTGFLANYTPEVIIHYISAVNKGLVLQCDKENALCLNGPGKDLLTNFALDTLLHGL